MSDTQKMVFRPEASNGSMTKSFELGVLQIILSNPLPPNVRSGEFIIYTLSFWDSIFTHNFFKYKSKQCTTYSKTGLLYQLVPSLSMCYAMRKLFDIPGEQERVINIDESMTYRFVKNTKSWTF